jgi:hypothetical protein
MSKSTKKRNKPYTGVDAARSTPHVRRYSVEERSNVGNWWHENKRPTLVRSALVAIAMALSWLIYSVIH